MDTTTSNSLTALDQATDQLLGAADTLKGPEAFAILCDVLSAGHRIRQIEAKLVFGPEAR